MRTLLLALVVAATAGWPARMAHAELSATAVMGDSRLVDFEYDEDNVYLIVSRPKRSTFIRFGADEKIVYVSAGDTRNFEFPVAKSFEFMEVKPKFDNTETNVTVVTTRRTYHLIVRSTFDGGKWYARVSWKYPQVALLDLTRQAAQQDAALAGPAAGIARPARPLQQATEAEVEADTLERLNFHYDVTGNAPFKPVRVMDNGVFTYVALPPGLQELPAVFRTEPDDPSRMALVSYEVRQGTIVVQRLMDSFILKLGRDEVRVERAGRSRETSHRVFAEPADR